MSQNLISRAIAVVLLGVLFGYYIQYDERKTRHMDREQYLAREAHKYDESKSDPTPLPAMILGAVIVLGLFVTVYEVVVIVISGALKSRGVAAGKSAGDTNIPFS